MPVSCNPHWDYASLCVDYCSSKQASSKWHETRYRSANVNTLSPHLCSKDHLQSISCFGDPVAEEASVWKCP